MVGRRSLPVVFACLFSFSALIFPIGVLLAQDPLAEDPYLFDQEAEDSHLEGETYWSDFENLMLFEQWEREIEVAEELSYQTRLFDQVLEDLVFGDGGDGGGGDGDGGDGYASGGNPDSVANPAKLECPTLPSPYVVSVDVELESPSIQTYRLNAKGQKIDKKSRRANACSEVQGDGQTGGEGSYEKQFPAWAAKHCEGKSKSNGGSQFQGQVNQQAQKDCQKPDCKNCTPSLGEGTFSCSLKKGGDGKTSCRAGGDGTFHVTFTYTMTYPSASCTGSC